MLLLLEKFPDIEFFGLNHDMEIPYDLINKHDKVVVCDISLPVPYMFELNEKIDFTWIDHHVSVINEYEEFMKTGDYKPLKGIRKIGTAAIKLTWEYYFPEIQTPEGVELLALNDLFMLSDPRVRPFEYAFQSMGVNPPTDEIWETLFNNEININDVVDKGNAILSWIKIRNYRLVRNMAFESEYMGYKCICANMPQGYSEFFDSIPNVENYDFMCNFMMNKKNTFNLSFYTAKENVDVSKIAASFGGGGHMKAAGASKLKNLPEFLKQGKTI